MLKWTAIFEPLFNFRLSLRLRQQGFETNWLQKSFNKFVNCHFLTTTIICSLSTYSYLHKLAEITYFYESTNYEFIPCDLLKMVLFFKFKHSIKFWATWLRISGEMTMNFGQHDSGFGWHDFGQDESQATWPVTDLTAEKYCQGS